MQSGPLFQSLYTVQSADPVKNHLLNLRQAQIRLARGEDPLRAFTPEEVKNIKKLQENVKVFATPEWQSWASQKSLDKVAQFACPGYIYSADKKKEKAEIQELEKTLKEKHALAPDQSSPTLNIDRGYSKERVITGTAYTIGKDKDRFHPINLIIACAPNFMGTSPEDFKEFCVLGEKIGEIQYIN